jgi:hypothetical protein
MCFFAVQIPWDVEEYYIKCIKAGRDKKRLKFPNPQLGSFSDPLTLVDVKGRIVLWYLPGLLSEHDEVSYSVFLWLMDRLFHCARLRFVEPPPPSLRGSKGQ